MCIELSEFEDWEIEQEFKIRGLYHDLEIADLSEFLIEEILEMGVYIPETLTKKLLYDKFLDFLEEAGPLELVELENYLNEKRREI